MQTNLHLQKDVSLAMHDPIMFRSVVGALQYVEQDALMPPNLCGKIEDPVDVCVCVLSSSF